MTMSAASQFLYRRVFSGIQPTGTPHLGNYLGALRQWVALQEKAETAIYSIVDLHAVTSPQEPAILRNNIQNMAAVLLACGIDPSRSILFQQSTVPQHSELGWLLMCRSPIGHLRRMPQWKLKMNGSNSDVKMGLLSYPVLQAADILLYKATHVPVGDDQVQHMNFARFLAESFNSAYGEVFALPQPILTDAVGMDRVRSLRSPMAKMSKSDLAEGSCVFLDDTPDGMRRKFGRAVTDMTTALSYDPEQRPGVSNLVAIYSAFSGLSQDEVCKKFEGNDTAEFKAALANLVAESLEPIREKLAELQKRPGFVEDVLHDGAVRAKEHAKEVLSEVKTAMGLD